MAFYFSAVTCQSNPRSLLLSFPFAYTLDNEFGSHLFSPLNVCVYMCLYVTKDACSIALFFKNYINDI